MRIEMKCFGEGFILLFLGCFRAFECFKSPVQWMSVLIVVSLCSFIIIDVRACVRSFSSSFFVSSFVYHRVLFFYGAFCYRWTHRNKTYQQIENNSLKDKSRVGLSHSIKCFTQNKMQKNDNPIKIFLFQSIYSHSIQSKKKNKNQK